MSESVELLIQNDLECSVFTYLFELQESGVTNMFGAAAYIIRQRKFSHIKLVDAEILVNKWMTNYEAIKAELTAVVVHLK